jgi:hypothetical protein
MKNLLYIFLMSISFLNQGQSLESMKYVHKITFVKIQENNFDQQDRIRQNINNSIPKISKEEQVFNSYKYNNFNPLIHPNTQRQLFILNPNNARNLQEMVILGVLKKRRIQF